MSDVDKAFADVKVEGDTDPFKDIPETETPSESQPEKEPETAKPEEGEGTPEENVPFHKHPRWIERENELNELRERDEARAKEIEELKSLKTEPSSTNIPDWFVKLYGENEPAYKAWQEQNKSEREQIKTEILAEQEQKRVQAETDIKKWNKWVEDEVKGLQDEGKQFDRNELIKVMLEYRPTDENNNFDFKKGYAIMEALKAKEVDPARSIARKEIADKATRSSSGDKPKKDYQTQNELRGKSWNQL